MVLTRTCPSITFIIYGLNVESQCFRVIITRKSRD
nr:MAG TPA: hypothetical protein [Caudoviricetes sp.]DAO01906.1 MAG TPA: hypothetical protein [Caudoviricetes sp.]DAX93376.1 MAG TPA: hypothetical protein [Bacteriophage sp.]